MDTFLKQNNKEARRLYAELKSLAHLISDEIMMPLYGISEIMMSQQGIPFQSRESPKVSLRKFP